MKRIVSCLIVVVLLVSCATQKSRQDQSQFGKFYHNVTAKFNGYFNANEIVEESIDRLNAQHRDNYNDLLKIYKYRAAPNPEAVAADLDEAIKKVSIVVTLHEGSHWVDDCYLLIGKSYYLKQDFESAQNAFEFFMDEFNPDGSRVDAASSRKESKSQRASSTKRSKSSRKASKRRAREAEKARKEYNKQVRRKRRKQSKRGGDKSDSDDDRIVATKRSTTPDPPEEQKEEKTISPQGSQNPGGMSHKPAYQEAVLWLARTYVERENYPRAEYYLNSLRNNKSLQDEVKAELPKVWAYYAIHRENYKGAIPHLEEAVGLTNKKRERARLAYILAQIAEMEEKPVKAREYYSEVLDNNPDYELEFNARLSLARTALTSGTQSRNEIVKSLEKMLRDDKNVDYRDQIYFTLAQIALEDGSVRDAIDYLVLAAEHGSQNTTQLTETNYLLATLYFEQEDYINAKAAYDAVLQTMDKTDERYVPTERLAKNLTDIAKHLTDIALQDSLLRLSEMSDEELLVLASQIQKERKASSADNQGASVPSGPTGKGSAGRGLATSPELGRGAVQPPGGPGSRQSSFFAYDEKSLRRGKREFEKQWGDRPLSDNWRLASKLVAETGFSDTDTFAVPAARYIPEEEVADIFRDVPKTEEEKQAAREIVQNAMLQLGSLYREKLEYHDKSIAILEDLLRSYPDTKFRLDTYYQLYLSYLSINDVANANRYKEKIITEFSQSKYALALSDPDYINKQLSEEERLENFYNGVYELVDAEQYEQAKEQIRSGKEQFGTNHMYQPKLSILEAMCIGNLEGREAYVTALKDIVGAYPNTPEETKARDMLLLLGEYKGSRLNLQRGTTSGPDFRMDVEARHYILILINNFEEVDMNEAKISIHNYNNKYHRLDRLKVTTLVFDPSTRQSLILIRTFKNAERALVYHENALKHENEYLPEHADYEIFPVSEWNYRQIIKQRSLDGYAPFFESNYDSN